MGPVTDAAAGSLLPRGGARALLAVVLPPPFDEALSAAQLRSTAAVRAFIIAFAIVLDVSIVGVLWNDPEVRRTALQLFGGVNVALLSVDLILTLTALRRASVLWEPAFVVCLLIEATTTIIWVQLTGSLSSYFLSAIVMLVGLYRVGFAWRHGVILAGAMMGCHVIALTLEATGVLPPASLFVAVPAGIYASPGLRIAATSSILATYAVVLMGANQVVLRLREKDAALARARRELALMMEKVQTGRLSGKLQGDWLMLELIGVGGMGEVYRAQRVSDRQDAAVKVLHPHLAARPEVLERFRRESDIAGRLPSCTAQVLEIGSTDAGEPFIAWELLRGEDLASRLRRSERLPISEVVHLVAELAALLELAHAAGVVHRDLKPSNVFLAQLPGVDGAREQARLLDFGIAGLLDGSELTQTSAVLGSPGYLAPEQARGDRPAVGPHSDVFALGAIAYRAITGTNAFPARDPVAALYEAQHLTPTRITALMPAMPTDVDVVIALALAKRISDRYARAPQFAADLARAAAGGLDDVVRARARALRDDGTERTLTNV